MPLFPVATRPRQPGELPPSLQAIARQGVRLATPCEGGGQVVWHAFGPVQAEPLVLLHGGSGSWTHWARNVLALASGTAQHPGRRVLAVDLPGFGESDLPPGARDADDLLAPLAAGMATLAGREALDVVGFSFGGLTAGLLAQAWPDRVRRLVIVGAPGLGLVPHGTLPLQGWRHLPEAERRAVHRHNLRAMMLHEEASLDEQDGLAVQIQESNVPHDRLPGRRLAFTPALRAALGSVQAPLAVVYGERDALYQGRLSELQATYRQHAPTLRAFTLIPGAGHWVQYERADAFHAALWTALGPSAA